MEQQIIFTLSNFHEDLHGFCLAHPSLLVIQALQRPIWCCWLKNKRKIKINKQTKKNNRKSTGKVMWTWVSESRNLLIYQDLFLLLRLTYETLWNVESQMNEYTGKPYNIYKWRRMLSMFQIYTAILFFQAQLTEWLTWTKTQYLAKRWWSQLKRKPWQAQRSKALKIHPFFFPQQYLSNHHLTPASSITNLLLEKVNTYKRPRWKLRFCTDWKTI